MNNMKINNSAKANLASQKEKSKQAEIDAFAPKFKDLLENKDLEGLKKVASDFEELFVNIILKTMRSSVPKSSIIENTYQKEVFEGMLDEKYAEKIAESGDFGIAKMLMESFEPYLKDQIVEEPKKIDFKA